MIVYRHYLGFIKNGVLSENDVYRFNSLSPTNGSLTLSDYLYNLNHVKIDPYLTIKINFINLLQK